MSKASFSNGTGPGASISLAPETVRIRDALIEKFSGAPLEDMTNFMRCATDAKRCQALPLRVGNAVGRPLLHGIRNLGQMESRHLSQFL